MTKRLLLVLAALAALIALAAPTVAHAEELVKWYTTSGESEVPLEEVEKESEAKAAPFKISGDLTFTAPGPIDTEKCSITLEGDAVNLKGKGAAGAVEKGTASGCGTNLAQCKAVSGVVQNFPWSIQAKRVGGVINSTFGGTTFGFKYEAFCGTYGIPNTGLGFAGELKGTFDDTTQCLKFTKSGNLKREDTGEAVEVDGELCMNKPMMMK